MSTLHNFPDPVGLAIAREIQDRLRPAEVILFGSRADGSHSPGHRGPHRHSPGRGRRQQGEGDSPGNSGRTARRAGDERHNDAPGGVPAVGPAGPILCRAGRPLRRDGRSGSPPPTRYGSWPPGGSGWWRAHLHLFTMTSKQKHFADSEYLGPIDKFRWATCDRYSTSHPSSIRIVSVGCPTA